MNSAAHQLDREPSLATFLRLFVLAAFVYATVRTPRSVFALRALAPETAREGIGRLVRGIRSLG